MNLSIIIVNYKSRLKLLNCLTTLTDEPLQGMNYEVIVVENNSGENLNDLLTQYPQLKLMVSPKNLGMGGGNNLGIKAATGEYILVLNPDTIVTSNVIVTLLNYLKNNPTVGLVGPKLLYPDGTLQSSCARFPKFFMPFLRRTFLGEYFKKSRDRFTMNDFDHNSIREVDWLMGSCLMFKKHLVSQAGVVFDPLFDKRYFMYFEDIDLARQFWTKGWRVVYNPEAIVIHDHARESAKHPWYIALWHDKIIWVHIISWLKYFVKWGFNNIKYEKN